MAGLLDVGGRVSGVVPGILLESPLSAQRCGEAKG